MLQRRDQLAFTPEPVDAHAGRHVGWEHLDNHAPSQRRLNGHEDPAHTPTAELALDLIRVTKGGPEPGLEVSDHYYLT